MMTLFYKSNINIMQIICKNNEKAILYYHNVQ